MSYRKYSGKDKYHFRYYHLSNNHPFLVVLVLDERKKKGKVLISGFGLTSSDTMPRKKPTKYIKLSKNPNPNDDSPSYVHISLVQLKQSKLFSDPIDNWHLSKEDEKKIDDLLLKKNKKMIHKDHF